LAKNLAQAANWYRKAADAGDKVAQHNLGVLYRDGLGVEKNEAEALAWFQKSAEQGYAKAQLNLGQLYEKMATQKK
jgi:TPR repeat protein